MIRLFVSVLFSLILSFFSFSYPSAYNNLSSETQININNTGQDTLSSGLSVRIDSFNLNIIPPSSGVQFYKEGIMFLSGSGVQSRMVPLHISFGTIQAYYAAFTDTMPLSPVIFPASSAFTYPCEAVSFNNDYSTMYFTKRGKKDRAEKIYTATYSPATDKKAEKWTESPAPLDFCTGSYVYTHPTVSADESFMIFASDKDGSTGRMDLFISRKTDNKWSAPENLGKVINTSSNELFPMLDSANNLYFSSEGHPGYGGYDVFICPFNGKGWEEPYNLTSLINTPDDEVAFTLDRKDNKTGFVTIKKRNNDLEAQLYRINFQNEFAPDTIKNLSSAILDIALSDMNFPHKGLVAEVLIPESVDKEPEKTVTKKDTVKISPAVSKKDITQEPLKETAGIKTEEKRTEPVTNHTTKEKAGSPAGVKKTEALLAAEIKPSEITSAVTKKEEITSTAKSTKNEKTVAAKKARIDTVRVVSSVRNELRDIVIYRVQFLSTAKQENIKEITVNGQRYDTYIYYYLKEYRYTAGEFTTLEPARELQAALRKSGYPQAFVAAFKNNIRSLDLSLFR